MRKITLLSIFTSTLLLMACNNNQKGPSAANTGGTERNKPLKIEAYIVRPEGFAETLEIPGTLAAMESVSIQPEISGRIIALPIQEGRLVEKGTLLAKLYDADLVAQLNKLEVQLELAKRTEERQAQLLQIQGISQQDYDISLLQVNNLKADIGIIRTAIQKTEIRAPFSGKLGLRNISVGAWVNSSTVIALLSQRQQLNLDFSIPEKYVSKLRIGQIIQFTTEGIQRENHAQVVATETNVAETSRSLTVRARVSGNQAHLIPGNFAKVRISFDPDPQALLIPTQAIIPQARGKKVILYKDGKAIFIDVMTGVRSADRIQILEGLATNDTVVVTGLMSIRPDNTISIAKIQNPAP